MRTCRECGCTELNACVVDRNGEHYACFWVDEDFCSFCALRVDVEEREPERPAFRGVDVVMPAAGIL